MYVNKYRAGGKGKKKLMYITVGLTGNVYRCQEGEREKQWRKTKMQVASA